MTHTPRPEAPERRITFDRIAIELRDRLNTAVTALAQITVTEPHSSKCIETADLAIDAAQTFVSRMMTAHVQEVERASALRRAASEGEGVTVPRALLELVLGCVEGYHSKFAIERASEEDIALAVGQLKVALSADPRPPQSPALRDGINAAVEIIDAQVAQHEEDEEIARSRKAPALQERARRNAECARDLAKRVRALGATTQSPSLALAEEIRVLRAVADAAQEVVEWASYDKHGRAHIGPGKFDPLKEALAALSTAHPSALAYREAFDDLLSAGKRILVNLEQRIDAAPSNAKPVFDGIADLHDAISKAESCK